MSLHVSTVDAERGNIAIDADYDVRYWTKELDVNEQQLRAVVRAVGNSVVTVRARLRQLGRL